MLINLIVVILIVGLALYAVQLVPIDARITLLLQLLIVIVAILFLAGLL